MIEYIYEEETNKLICKNYRREYMGGFYLEEVSELDLADEINKMKYLIINCLYQMDLYKINVNIYSIDIKMKKGKVNQINVPICFSNFMMYQLSINTTAYESSNNKAIVINALNDYEKKIKSEIIKTFGKAYEDLLNDYELIKMC